MIFSKVRKSQKNISRQKSVNHFKTAYILNLSRTAKFGTRSNLSLIHITKLLHRTNNFVLWGKIACHVKRFCSTRQFPCGAKLLHMKFVAPRPMSAASATNMMYGGQSAHCALVIPNGVASPSLPRNGNRTFQVAFCVSPFQPSSVKTNVATAALLLRWLTFMIHP